MKLWNRPCCQHQNIHRKIYPVEAGNKWEDNGWYSMLKFALRRMNQLTCISNESCMHANQYSGPHTCPCKQDYIEIDDLTNMQHVMVQVSHACMLIQVGMNIIDQIILIKKQKCCWLIRRRVMHAIHPSIHQLHYWQTNKGQLGQ